MELEVISEENRLHADSNTATAEFEFLQHNECGRITRNLITIC